MEKSLPKAASVLPLLSVFGCMVCAAPSEEQLTDPAAIAINALGIDLLQNATRPDANALLSPYSIQIGLAMAYAGADGVTHDEMKAVLHYPKEEALFYSRFRALNETLEQVVESTEQRPQRTKGYVTSEPIV